MEEIFVIIGKLYLDVVHNQKIIEELQKQLAEKEKEISSLQASIISNNGDM